MSARECTVRLSLRLRKLCSSDLYDCHCRRCSIGTDSIHISTMITALLTFISRHRKEKCLAFWLRLTSEGRWRGNQRVPRIVLQAPSMSAWTVLFKSGSYQAFIKQSGLDHRAFRYVLTRFEDFYNQFPPYSTNGCITRKRGTCVRRKRLLSARDCLGLVPKW